jgi:hypothetical protein
MITNGVFLIKIYHIICKMAKYGVRGAALLILARGISDTPYSQGRCRIGLWTVWSCGSCTNGYRSHYDTFWDVGLIGGDHILLQRMSRGLLARFTAGLAVSLVFRLRLLAGRQPLS